MAGEYRHHFGQGFCPGIERRQRHFTLSAKPDPQSFRDSVNKKLLRITVPLRNVIGFDQFVRNLLKGQAVVDVSKFIDAGDALYTH